MKYLKILVILLFNNYIFSQSKTTIPKSGSIVFVKKTIVLDRGLYINSIKDLMPKMKDAIQQQIITEQFVEGKVTDTIALKEEVEKIGRNLEMMLPFLIDEELNQEIKFHNVFNEDVIQKYHTFNGQQLEKSIEINQKTYEVKNGNNDYIEIEKKEVVKVIEFRNETKLINDYNCFRVLYTYIDPKVAHFNYISTTVNNTRELWVTEEIKCNYHPVINETEILEKYYPLEIIEYSDEIKGFITKYELVEFSLK